MKIPPACPLIRILFSALLLGVCCNPAHAQTERISLPSRIDASHPRIATITGGKHSDMEKRLLGDPSLQTEVRHAESELAPYMASCAKDPMWLASRLQMYWKTHASEIYNRGDVFDHADGTAPVATVRYPGSRNPLSIYRAPKIEDIPPYEDETRGVWLVNTSLPNQPMEWAQPSKTGRVIDAINTHILHLASTAAKLYWITGEEHYAKFAAPVLDTYLRGMYYRHEPIDLLHGHSQTIYGMSTFEVIQEYILHDVAVSYDYLYGYIQQHDSAAIPIYADAMRHWIDLTIRNGVPFNNWDLFEARLIAAVALVLDNDDAYSDHHGEQFYVNTILNDNTIGHWSLGKLAERGFDAKTGIWFESPGYSMNVVKDFIALLNDLDQSLGMDLLPDFPVVDKAVLATGQYLYPNGYTVSYGDAHHVLLSSTAAREMVKNAQRHHRREQEIRFTAMAKFLENNAVEAGHRDVVQEAKGLDAVLSPDATNLDASVAPMTMAELVSSSFSAPSVSYFVQRNGLDKENGLMAAEAGSLGNHQHANGIELELYGRGLILAPESGIGTNYFESDYAEYYSQFPASNTVAVDGISSYPTMKSNHGFQLMAAYPAPSAPANADAPVTFSDVYFHEPETDSDQRRQVSIIRTSPTDGYYVDIFRSHRRDGKDRMNDYFFHGIGQQMEVTDAVRKPLSLTPTNSLAFADEELPAYDYFRDKRSTQFSGDYRIRFELSTSDKNVQMNLWMAGSPDREIFAVKAPASHAIGDMLPRDLASMPMPTLVARQHGEAWTRPFVAVFEPTDQQHPTAIASIHSFHPDAAPSDFAGLDIANTDGSRQQIFSTTDTTHPITYAGVRFQGSFAVVGDSGTGRTLMLGNGTLIADDNVALEFSTNHGAELHYGEADWLLTTNDAAILVVSQKILKGASELRYGQDSQMTIKGRLVEISGEPALEFALPPLHNSSLHWETSPSSLLQK